MQSRVLPLTDLKHLQGTVRELIWEAAKRGGVSLLLYTAAPCYQLPAAKVGGNGGSGKGKVS